MHARHIVPEVGLNIVQSLRAEGVVVFKAVTVAGGYRNGPEFAVAVLCNG